MAVVSENYCYCDYSDGSWCDISSVNNDDVSSVDSFERVDYDSDEEFLSSMVGITKSLFATSNNVIEKVDDDQLQVSTNDLVSKSDIEDAVFDALKKELGLDDDEEMKLSEKSDNEVEVLDSLKEEELDDQIKSEKSDIEVEVFDSLKDDELDDDDDDDEKMKSKNSDIEVDVLDSLKEKELDDEKMESLWLLYYLPYDEPEPVKEDKEANKDVSTRVSTDEDVAYGKPDDHVLVGEKTPSTEDKDYKVLVFEDEDVFVGERTPKEAEVPTRSSPFIQDKYAASEIIPDVLFGEKAKCEAKDAKVPTGEDDELGELIKDAQEQLDKKRRTRDLFRAQIAQQQSRVNSHNDALTAANKKIMAARQLVVSKKHEIGYVEDVIKRFRDIVLVEDIDINLRKMEKRIQNECMSLSDEKKLYREISHLRRVRELGSRYEVQEALDRKQHIDDLVKDIKEELKVLQNNLSKSEEAAQAINKTLEKDGLVEEEMWAQYKVIQDSREEASVYLEGLKKRLDAKKNGILTHDESKRAHRKEETNKEGIDAVLKDLRDLEKEVCNDASRGATHYSSYPPTGHYSSYPPTGHYSSYPPTGHYSSYSTLGYYSYYPTQGYYPSYPPQGYYYSSYPTPGYYSSYPPHGYHSSYPAPGYYSSYPTQGHQVTSPVNPTYKPMARKPMDRQKQNVEKTQMQAEQKAQKEAEKREEERLAMERQGQDAKIAQMQAEELAQKKAEQIAEDRLAMERQEQDAKIAQMQAEELAQKKYEQIVEECRQKHDVKKAQMQAEQQAQKEAEQIEEERLAMERQKRDAGKAQMRAEQRAEQKDEEKLKPLIKRKEKKKAKSRIDGVELTINGTTINISRIFLEDLIFGLLLMVFFAILHLYFWKI